MSETISIPVNLWLRGLHLGRERSHAGMGQVNDGQAWAQGGGGEGRLEVEVRRSTRLQRQKQITAVGDVLGISLLSHHSTVSNNEK